MRRVGGGEKERRNNGRDKVRRGETRGEIMRETRKMRRGEERESIRKGGRGAERGPEAPAWRGPVSGAGGRAGGWFLVVTGAQRKLSYTCHAIPSRATSEAKKCLLHI